MAYSSQQRCSLEPITPSPPTHSPPPCPLPPIFSPCLKLISGPTAISSMVPVPQLPFLLREFSSPPSHLEFLPFGFLLKIALSLLIWLYALWQCVSVGMCVCVQAYVCVCVWGCWWRCQGNVVWFVWITVFLFREGSILSVVCFCVPSRKCVLSCIPVTYTLICVWNSEYWCPVLFQLCTRNIC